MQSFPSREEFYSVTSALNGSTVTPTDEGYSSATIVYNRRLAANPYTVVYVKSVEDVQKVKVLLEFCSSSIISPLRSPPPTSVLPHPPPLNPHLKEFAKRSAASDRKWWWW